LEQYLHYLQKLSPYLKLTLDEENSSPSSSKLLESINGRLVSANHNLTNTVQRLSSLVLVLSMQSKRNKQSSSANLKVVVFNLIDGLASLHKAVAELFSTFEQKSQLENHNEQFNSTNKCIINALICLVSTTAELHSLLEEGKAEIVQSALAPSKFQPPRKSHPMVAEFRARACAYLKGLEGDEQPMSVPYEEALKHREESVGGSKSREVLAEQLATALRKAMQLEQDKEHWKQEYQLLQMKYAKEQESSKELQSGVATTPSMKDAADESAECQSSTEIVQHSPESTGQPFSFTSMVRMFEQIPKFLLILVEL
jgi:Predicted coiled-coil domain-containing protein